MSKAKSKTISHSADTKDRRIRKGKHKSGSVTSSLESMGPVPSFARHPASLGDQELPPAFALVCKFLDALDRATHLPRAVATGEAEVGGGPGLLGGYQPFLLKSASSFSKASTSLRTAATYAGLPRRASSEKFVAATNLAQPAGDLDLRSATSEEGEVETPRERTETPSRFSIQFREATARSFRERLLLDLLRRTPKPPSFFAVEDVVEELLGAVPQPNRDRKPPPQPPDETESAPPWTAGTPLRPSVVYPDPDRDLPDGWRQAVPRLPLAFQEQLLNEQNVGLREGPDASETIRIPYCSSRSVRPPTRRPTWPVLTPGGRLRCEQPDANASRVRVPKLHARHRKPRAAQRRAPRRLTPQPSPQSSRTSETPHTATRPERESPCECHRPPKPSWVAPCAPPPPSPREREMTLRRQTARATAAEHSRNAAGIRRLLGTTASVATSMAKKSDFILPPQSELAQHSNQTGEAGKDTSASPAAA